VFSGRFEVFPDSGDRIPGRIATVRIGIDYRPALVQGDGIGRYTRELVRGFVQCGFEDFRLYGSTAAGTSYGARDLGLREGDARLVRWRVPSKLMPGLLKLMHRGIDDLIGGVDVFHHTQYNRLPVRRALEFVMLHDILFIDCEHIVSEEVARRMTSFASGLAREAAGITVPTEHVRRRVIERLGAPAERVSVTPLGCDHVLRYFEGGRPPSAEGREPLVLSVSRVDLRKNYLRMLEAFEVLVRDGFPHRWVIAGAPGYGHEAFLEALERSPVRDRVQWLRFVDDAELARLYSIADVYLLATLDEGFGITALEAMVCNVPVVTSDVSAVREVTGGAACLVAPEDPAAILDGLRRVLAERDWRVDLVQRGHERARQFTWRRTAAATLAAYARAAHPEVT